MTYRDYSHQDFINAVKNSTSIRQAIESLGLKAAGGNYKTFHSLAQKLNADLSHFKGQGWNKGLRHGHKRPLSAYLSTNIGS